MKVLFEIEIIEQDIQKSIKAFSEEGNENISKDLNNVRMLILEGLKTIATEITMDKTKHLVSEKESNLLQ